MAKQNKLYSISEIEPDYTLRMSNREGEIGKLDWSSGTLKFTGKADESAKVFFDFLKEYVDKYIEAKLKKKENNGGKSQKAVKIVAKSRSPYKYNIV